MRCGSKQGEEDYRPLFENFVHDLLSTVNKPEWPAAELLLSLLGRLLVSRILHSRSLPALHPAVKALSSVLQVHQFSNKQTEMALRVASLDYLGTVASRLRKDAVTVNVDQKSIDRILRGVETFTLDDTCSPLFFTCASIHRCETRLVAPRRSLVMMKCSSSRRSC